MLLRTEAVRKWTVGSVNRFLEPDGKILFEVRHCWSLLTDDVSSDIVGIVVREHGSVESSADRHVVHGIGGSGQKPAHSGTVVVAVGAPERRELIPSSILGAPS